MRRYSEYCAKKTAQYGDKFSAANLAPQFVAPFNEGEQRRVLVAFCFKGREIKRAWGFVGVTTGWQPCFLLMRRRGQRGSSDTLGADDKILAQRGFK